MATGTPIKQYEFHKSSHFSTSNFEVKQDGSTILKIRQQSGVFRKPEIDILAPSNTVLASVKLETFSRGALLHLGNPEGSDKSAWTAMDAKGFTSSSYEFPFNGRTYAWTRTHDSDLGASKFGNGHFKLVDKGNGQVLAVYIYNYAIVKQGVLATVDFYMDLGQELESMSLAAVMGVEARITRNQQASAAGAAATA